MKKYREQAIRRMAKAGDIRNAVEMLKLHFPEAKLYTQQCPSKYRKVILVKQ